MKTRTSSQVSRLCYGLLAPAVLVLPLLAAWAEEPQPARAVKAVPARLQAPPAAPGTVVADDPKPGKADHVQDLVFLGETRPVLVRLYIHVDGKPFRQVWEDFMTHLFKTLDSDGDGFLSRAEAARAPAPQTLFNATGGVDFTPPTLEVLDANRDGKVSRDELAAFYRRNGGAPFTVTGRQSNDSAQYVYVGGQQPTTPEALNEALFKLLDTSNDGKLTKEKLAAAPAVLLKFDSNDDEMITGAELVPSNPTNPYVVRAMPGQPVGQQGSANVWVKGAGSSEMDLARQLQARYGPKNNQPAGKKLTRKDLGLDEETFARLDADGDGVLDREELAHFAQRDPDVQLNVRLGSTNRGEETVAIVPSGDRPSPLSGQLRKGPDGGAVLDLGNTRLDVRTGPSGNEAFAVANLKEYYKAQFRAADRDNNGYLDRTEAQQNRVFRGLFATLDTKGEGKVYEKDVLAWVERTQDLQARAARACVSLAVSDAGKGLFDLLDTNRDGRLSVREMRGAIKLLDSLDRENKGHLTRADIPRSYQMTVKQGAPNFAALGGPRRVVVNGTMDNRPLPQRTAGPLWFRKMDRNHDGDVSRREFLGSDEDFRRIDTDGDGLISVEEAIKADEWFRNRQKEAGR
jgi:Ca2+-binding EF-hand superfamily protein